MIERDIDLIIRAQVERGNDLESITKSIKKLEEAIDQQSAAAKRGESSIDGLKATLAELELVQKKLVSSGKLIDEYKRLGPAIEATSEKFEKAKAKVQAYQEKLKDLAEVTDKQQAQAIKLGKTAQTYENRLAAQRVQLDSVVKALQAANVNTADLASAEAALLEVTRRSAVARQQAGDALASYNDDIRKAIAAQKTLTDARAAEARDQAAFAKTEKFYNDARARRAADADEVAEIIRRREAKKEAELSDRNAEIAANKRADDELRATKKREAELAEFRKQITEKWATKPDVANPDAALSKNADDAERAARGYNTLARAADTLIPKTGGLRDSIAAILDPAKAAKSTIGGLEDEIAKLAKSIGDGSRPVENYRQTLSQLGDAQRALSTQSGLIDSFQQQVAQLRAARTEYVQARTQMLQYADAVRQGGAAGEAQVRALSEAQARTRSAATALAQQVRATREMRDSVRDAGIATNDLASAQQRLTASANTTVAATNALAQANRHIGESSNEGAKGFRLFRDEGRTTLSLFQRLRGEILSLVAATLGIPAAMQLAKSSIQSLADRQSVNTKLSVAVDSSDPKVVGKEYDYVAEKADYFGFRLKELANQYASYAIAAKSANLTTEQSKYIFESLTGGMRVLNLNTEQSGRAWTQINQILTKTKPELEDIKTIAESGFVGIQSLMARGLRNLGVAGVNAGTEVNDMLKLLKDGALDSRVAIYALAVQAQEDLGKKVPEAIKNLVAEQGRFQTSIDNFQVAIGKGWEKSYLETLTKIREILSSSDGDKLANSIASSFEALAKLAVFLLENIQTIKTVLVAIGAIVATNAIANVGDKIQQFIGAAKSGAAEIGKFQSAIMLLQAAIVGFSIGTWANDNFEIVQKFGIGFVSFMLATWESIKGAFEIALEFFPTFARNIFGKVLDTARTWARAFIGLLGSIAKSVGMDKLGQALDEMQASLSSRFVEESYDRVKAAEARMNSAIANIQKIAREQLADVGKDFTPPKVNQKVELTNRPKVAPGNRLTGDTEKEADRVKKLIESLDAQLNTLEAKIDRAQTDSLQGQLEAIDKTYKNLKEKIEGIGGKEGAALMTRLNELTSQLSLQAIIKFNSDLDAQQESLQKKLDQMNAAAGRDQRNNLTARLEAIKTQYASFFRDLDRLQAAQAGNNKDTSFIDRARKEAESAIEEMERAERIKFGREQLAIREKQLNDLIRERAVLLGAVNAQREAGKLDDVSAAEQINAINARTLPGIQRAAEAAKEWARANKEVFQRPEDLEVFLSTIDSTVLRIDSVTKAYGRLEQAMIDGAQNLISNGLNGVFEGLQKIVTGQMSVGEGFKSMLMSFGQFAAAFFRDIALMMAKMMIFKAMAGSGNDFMGTIGIAGLKALGMAYGGGAGVASFNTDIFGAAAGAYIIHGGGIVGKNLNRRRSAPSALFANATRYHAGGMPGLRSDEVPAILQKGEEVLSKNSPRNSLNGGAAANGAKQKGGQAGIRFVLVDDRARIPEAMAGAEGDQVIVQSIRKNASTIKQMLR